MIDKLNSYIWKNKKDIVNKDTILQDEVKMMNMSEYELRTNYNHCKNMLYNNSKSDPGRYLVLKEIDQQINNCTAELAIRWFCQLSDEKGNLKYSRFSLITEIKMILETLKDQYPKDKIFRIQDIYSGVPVDFNPVTIDSIIKGCKDTLGKFNRKHLTKSFIIKQGIWFTPEEIKDFKEIDKLRNIEEIIKTVKDRLGLSNSTDLKLKSSGLNYNQFRALMNLKINKKYSELTTIQLETLKNKILFNLEEQVFFHIEQWNKLMSQIEEVAEYKGIKL